MLLREISWEVTNQCNLQCKYCLPMSGPARIGELTTEEAMATLETFQGAGVSKICFTGGEPFSRKDFLGILERATALGMRTAVITNATLLQGATFGTVEKLGVELGVSLDGAIETTNDITRGQGSFRRAIGVLEQCQNASIPTTLYVTVTATNMSQLGVLARLAREYGCRGVHFNEVTISGRAVGFSNELALSAEQKKCLPELIARVALDIFGEQVSTVDGHCWVDGTALYMTADGNLYICSEIFQCRPEFAIGNIRSFPFKSWPTNEVPAYTQHEFACCYSVSVSEHVVFVGNVGSDCAFVPQRQNIESLAQLYEVLDGIYRSIEHDCRDCHDPDCMGYTWLLKEEAKRLYERGVPLVQVNNGPTFIHSFPTTAHGEPDLSVRYPLCSQLCTNGRRCSLYQERPLACRLYPLGLETKADGTIVWALHRDCLHIRRLEEYGLLPDFERRILNIVNNLSPQLLREIVETYRAVDAISSFPDGGNNFSSLQEVRHVEVQGRLGRSEDH
ncbi:MAG: radical SAM protein [Parcubacteria group bacterium]